MTVGEQEVYYCPMHPVYTSDRPGTCPICNMNLVKRNHAVIAVVLKRGLGKGRYGIVAGQVCKSACHVCKDEGI